MILTIKELQKYNNDILRTVSEICEKNNINWFMAYGSVLGAIRHQSAIPWDSDIDIYVPEPELKRFLKIMNEQLPDKYWVDFRRNNKKPRSFPRIGLSGYETEYLHIDVYRLGGLPTQLKEYKRFVKYSRFLFVTWKARTVDIDSYYENKKRRYISKMIKLLTTCIPMNWVLKQLDKQAGKVPYDKAEIVASPLTTMSRKRMIDRHVFDQSILVKYEDFYVRVPKNYEKYLETVFDNWRELPPLEERERFMNKTYEIKRIEDNK